MAIQGLFSTADFITEARPTNYREAVMLLYPNGSSPLFALTNLMKKETVDDPRFTWFEKQYQAKRAPITASISATITTLPVTNALAFKEGDLVLSEESGEIMRVSADPTVDTGLPVVRGQSGTTAATVSITTAGSNINMLRIGSAYEEGSEAPTGLALNPTPMYNFTQIFRDTLEGTRTGMATRLRTGDQMKEAKREALEMHSEGIERALLFGKRFEGTLNGRPWRTTDGIVSVLEREAAANVVSVKTDYSAGLTLEALENYLEQIFKYGSSQKLGFVGNAALTVIGQAVRKNATYNISSGEKEYGMNVTKLTCPHGELVLKSHPLFTNLTGGTTSSTKYYGYSNALLVLDAANLRYRNFKGADTQYETDLQSNGQDGKKAGYLTEAGLEVHHAQSHFLMKDIHAAAKEA